MPRPVHLGGDVRGPRVARERRWTVSRALKPTSFDAYAVACMLADHPLNGVASRVSKPLRTILDEAQSAPSDDRPALLETRLNKLMGPEKAATFIGSVAAIDPTAAPPQADDRPGVQVVRLSDVVVVPLEWLWENVFPLGKLSL